MRENALWQLTLCKIREFWREPEALFWVFLFPIILSLALGIAFRNKEPESLKVAVVSGPQAERAMAALEEEPGIRPELLSESEALDSLHRGKVAVLIEMGETDEPGDAITYRFDPARDESRTARLLADNALQSAAGRTNPRAVRTEKVEEKGSRYIDFLIPGLLGMNLMGTGMWGVGFSIVQSRMNFLLKRLIATPMKKTQYLLGQMFGRMAILFGEVGLLLIFAIWFFEVPFRGSIVTFGLATILGALAFSGFGLLVACRARTIEGVSGLMNFSMVPMWIFSGVFFSPSRFPDFLQPFIQALPLTALNDVLRGIMIDGWSLVEAAGELAIVAAWGVASFGTALYLFRWK